jgi:outer membrane receptor protein involved in Fe transport
MRRAALFLALCCVAGIARDAAAQSPLDRKVTVHVKDVALRDALDKVAVLAGIRLSYSGDNLPLDRRVSVDRDTAAVADVLGDLLRGFAVAPVATSTDHVVLSPRVPAEADTLSRSIAVLERVVVTGSVMGASERPLPIALDIVQGRDIERRHEGSLSEVLSGSVPGVWLWEHTPSSLLARYGSIRGASSFGLSYPKIYVDGIEVANPLLLTQITPEVVERVEVIRGPQGSALYGSDAISGVVNIVSRHEGVSPDGSRALLRSNLGFSGSRYGSDAQVPVQEHVLSIRGGSSLRSVGMTLGGSSSGQYIPQADSRELRGSADTRWIGAKSKLDAHARFLGKNAGVPSSPLLPTVLNDTLATDDDPQKLRLYSAGSTLQLVPNERWTYSLTAGFDGYTLSNVSNDLSPIPSVADTALRSANGRAVRGTVRANAVHAVVSPTGIGTTFTFGAERSDLWDRTDAVQTLPTGGPVLIQESSRSSETGLFGQAVVSVRDKAYLTAGLRQERIGLSSGPGQFSNLPLLGVALVQDFSNVAVKWRAGYGKGIRPIRTTLHLATKDPRQLVRNPDLAPEQQEGFEIGTDIRVGRRLGVHVTRFDQLVSGLIQMVTVPRPSSSGPGSDRSLWFQLQNLGEISNHGWETQASFSSGPLSLDGAATFVDSRVRRVAFSYTGDLKAGDRMLAVPSRTLSGTATWNGRRGLLLSSTISKASDWINYDRLRIAQELIRREKTADDLTGPLLRGFWRPYSGATRLRSSASVDVWRSMSLSVVGENLLDYQRGEPDTITIVPGRTVTVGLKARF